MGAHHVQTRAHGSAHDSVLLVECFSQSDNGILAIWCLSDVSNVNTMLNISLNSLPSAVIDTILDPLNFADIFRLGSACKAFQALAEVRICALSR